MTDASDRKVVIEAKMIAILKAMSARGGMVVAFSGGVDSTVVAKLARDSLGDRTVAVTADSESLPRSELDDARRMADLIGIEHLVIKHSELEKEWIIRNPKDRCYHCRKELAGLLKAVAQERGYGTIADGVNKDDHKEHRPGIKAADEAGIWHPFIEFDVTKDELRDMARVLGLPIADKPAAACLSSRIPYGETITREKLSQVERGEALLKELGVGHVRVRHHGDVARIEVPEALLSMFNDAGLRNKVMSGLKALGFRYVTLDLRGYRAGSMDEVLEKGE